MESATEPKLATHVLRECPFGAGDGISVEWLRFIRPEKKFDSIEALRTQISRDRDTAAALLQDPVGGCPQTSV